MLHQVPTAMAVRRGIVQQVREPFKRTAWPPPGGRAKEAVATGSARRPPGEWIRGIPERRKASDGAKALSGER